MSQVTSSSAYDISILSVIVSSDRFPETYEIVSNVGEINIFEHLDNAYLTASILFIDSSNILDMIKFRGTERVEIKLKIFGDDTAKEVVKQFMVSDIRGISPASDTSEAFILSLIEEHAYVNQNITLSKSYSGKCEKIIKDIIGDNFRLEIQESETYFESKIEPIKVIIPNISPLSATKWIRNRMMSENSLPFFLYSTLNGEKIFLKSLDSMLDTPILNANAPYVFGQAFTRQSTKSTVFSQSRVIEGYKLASAENMIGLTNNGTVNSRYDFLDTTTSSIASTKIDMGKAMKTLEDKSLLEQKNPIYDNKLKFEDKNVIEDHTASVITKVSTSGTFTNFANYHEAKAVEDQTVISNAFRYYLLKSPLEFTMPGFNYLGRGNDITIGRRLDLQFLRNDPNINEITESVLDAERSGEYLIYACRHIIRPEKYTVSLMGSKLVGSNGN